ncbi:hypothetical protein ACUHGC_00555 [Testudinibacter sp. P27/CKL/0425]
MDDKSFEILRQLKQELAYNKPNYAPQNINPSGKPNNHVESVLREHESGIPQPPVIPPPDLRTAIEQNGILAVENAQLLETNILLRKQLINLQNENRQLLYKTGRGDLLEKIGQLEQTVAEQQNTIIKLQVECSAHNSFPLVQWK